MIVRKACVGVNPGWEAQATLAAMAPVRVFVLLGVACALGGCGAGAREEVQAKVQQFAHAVAGREPATLCQQILAPALVDRLTAAGISCRDAMTTFVDSVDGPTLSIAKITVKGKTASAVVLTGARGQRASLESLQLIETSHGWRLASLASPT
jgi:hypothetical protein